MILTEAAEQALEALEEYSPIPKDGPWHKRHHKAITSLRAALAEDAMQRLTDEEIRRIDDATPFHEGAEWAVRFARAIEQAHGIGVLE